jgi:Tol biopolymer transport system component
LRTYRKIDNRYLVGDAVEDLLLIDISGEVPTSELLCRHNTSWIAQHTHPHPTFSWSSDKILFASDEGKLGQSRLYLVETEGRLK